MCVVFTANAQEKVINGTVSDSTGPLPGVNVVVRGTANGVETNFDGVYTIKAKEGDVLVFSFVGMETQEKVVGASNKIDVLLKSDELLEEVVIVGYGKQSQDKVVQNISVIKEEAIEDLQVVSADQLIQGQASGVQLVNSSGVLGSAAVIRVRGVNSISSGSQPLIVIDGVPITDNANTFNRGGNTGVNPLSYVNPNDIASFTVLKDAGATSIYGSRGANGVILITTKKGNKGGKVKVTLDVNTQLSESSDVPNILSADQFRKFKAEVASIQTGSTVTPESLGLGSIGTPGTDWLGGVQRTGFTQNYSLNARGGSEKTSFFFGLDFQDAESFIIGNDLERVGARVNINTDATDWLKLGINLGVTNTRLNRVSVENSINAPFTTAFLQSPVVPAFDADGNFVQSGSFVPNIFARVALDTDELKTFRVISNAFAEAEIFKGLTYKLEFGADKLQLEEFLRSADFNTPGGSATQLIVHDDRWLINQSLNYNTTIAEDHTIGLTLGMNYEESLRTRSNITGTGFLTDDLRNLGAANTVVVNNGDRSPARLFGLFSRLSYDYQGKYLVEGSFRRDGSSRFGANNRFGNFWSVSGGWVISREEFMKDGFFDYLSIRSSYGVVGNDRVGFFPSLGLFEAGSDGDYNGQSGVVPSQPANPDLKWEESATFDIGIRTKFLDEKISFNANYFKRKTSDLLLNQRLPPQTGFNSISSNIGEMENSGFEFDVNTVNFSTEDFEWTTSFNISFIDNKVTKLNDDAATDNQGRKIIDSGNQRAIEGESLNNFFLIRYKGVNPQTGDAEWLDADGNVTTSPTSNDRVVVGSPLPDFSGGITNTFKYRDFDLSFLMNYSYGNDIYIGGLRFMDGNDALGGIVNIRQENLNYWQNPGDNAFLPSPASSTFNAFNQTSTLQLRDGSYLRMKNITLGYNLPARLLEKSNLFSNVRFYATATNLFTIKADNLQGIDPEVTDDIDPRFQGESFFTAPQSRSYLLGVRLNF